MKALVSPQEQVQYISGWIWNATQEIWTPQFSMIENSQRVAQIAVTDDQTFPVSPSLSWIDCPEGCTTSGWYYNSQTQTFTEIANVAQPENPPA